MSRTPMPRTHPKRTAVAASPFLLLVPLTACGGSASAGDGSVVTATVGHQSKTINTVTAGTLLRSPGHFEKNLNSLHDGHTYKVDWQDYATGAPRPGCCPRSPEKSPRTSAR